MASFGQLKRIMLLDVCGADHANLEVVRRLLADVSGDGRVRLKRDSTGVSLLWQRVDQTNGVCILASFPSVWLKQSENVHQVEYVIREFARRVIEASQS